MEVGKFYFVYNSHPYFMMKTKISFHISSISISIYLYIFLKNIVGT